MVTINPSDKHGINSSISQITYNYTVTGQTGGLWKVHPQISH